VKLKFYGEEFPFELIEHSDCTITCLLVHTDETEEKFTELLEAQQIREEGDGEWYLDENGERLEPEKLFAASPWSLEYPDREIKLLFRIQERNGKIRFNTPDGYGGELFKWLRGRPPS
jgi:hypothetical protein